MKLRSSVAPVLLLAALGGAGGGLAAWKYDSLQDASAAAAPAAPVEAVTAGIATLREHQPTTTSIGTVLALRSITLRNELPGTVHEAMLQPGQIVEAGDMLVALDVSVEEAELQALEAQAELAESLFNRAQRLNDSNAVSDEELDRARAERDVALAQVTRTRAVIARKIIRAPFKARIGLADVHPGQYLNEGTVLTTLQGVDEAAHVDFEVAQHVAARLRTGDTVEVYTGGGPAIGSSAASGEASVPARIVAVDSRVDASTRNATVRARIEAGRAPAPGASVKVEVPAGPLREVVAVPASAVRKGPEGDHVFVLSSDFEGVTRAQLRPVESGAMQEGEVLILSGLAAGERVAASGSFKLQDAVPVAVTNEPARRDAAIADVVPGEPIDVSGGVSGAERIGRTAF